MDDTETSSELCLLTELPIYAPVAILARHCYSAIFIDGLSILN